MGVGDGGGLPAGVDGEGAVGEEMLFPRDGFYPRIKILLGSDREGGEGKVDTAGRPGPQAGAVCRFEGAFEGNPAGGLFQVRCTERFQLFGEKVVDA